MFFKLEPRDASTPGKQPSRTPSTPAISPSTLPSARTPAFISASELLRRQQTAVPPVELPPAPGQVAAAVPVPSSPELLACAGCHKLNPNSHCRGCTRPYHLSCLVVNDSSQSKGDVLKRTNAASNTSRELCTDCLGSTNVASTTKLPVAAAIAPAGLRDDYPIPSWSPSPAQATLTICAVSSRFRALDHLRTTPKDGHCLFSCFLHLARDLQHRPSATIHSLRQHCAEFFEATPDDAFVKQAAADGFTPASYRREVCHGRWGEHLEIHILSLLFKVGVTIYHPREGTISPIVTPPTNGPTAGKSLFLLHTNKNHYDVILSPPHYTTLTSKSEVDALRPHLSRIARAAGDHDSTPTKIRSLKRPAPHSPAPPQVSSPPAVVPVSPFVHPSRSNRFAVLGNTHKLARPSPATGTKTSAAVPAAAMAAATDVTNPLPPSFPPVTNSVTSLSPAVAPPMIPSKRPAGEPPPLSPS